MVCVVEMLNFSFCLEVVIGVVICVLIEWRVDLNDIDVVLVMLGKEWDDIWYDVDVYIYIWIVVEWRNYIL